MFYKHVGIIEWIEFRNSNKVNLELLTFQRYEIIEHSILVSVFVKANFPRHRSQKWGKIAT